MITLHTSSTKLITTLLLVSIVLISSTAALEIDLSSWPTSTPFYFPENVSASSNLLDNSEFIFRNANIELFHFSTDITNNTSIRITNSKIAMISFFSVLNQSKLQIDNCHLRQVNTISKCSSSKVPCTSPTIISNSIVNISSNTFFPPFTHEEGDLDTPLVNNANGRATSKAKAEVIELRSEIEQTITRSTKVLVENNHFVDSSKNVQENGDVSAFVVVGGVSNGIFHFLRGADVVSISNNTVDDAMSGLGTTGRFVFIFHTVQNVRRLSISGNNYQVGAATRTNFFVFYFAIIDHVDEIVLDGNIIRSRKCDPELLDSQYGKTKIDRYFAMYADDRESSIGLWMRSMYRESPAGLSSAAAKLIAPYNASFINVESLSFSRNDFTIGWSDETEQFRNLSSWSLSYVDDDGKQHTILDQPYYYCSGATGLQFEAYPGFTAVMQNVPQFQFHDNRFNFRVADYAEGIRIRIESQLSNVHAIDVRRNIFNQDLLMDQHVTDMECIAFRLLLKCVVDFDGVVFEQNIINFGFKSPTLLKTIAVDIDARANSAASSSFRTPYYSVDRIRKVIVHNNTIRSRHVIFAASQIWLFFENVTRLDTALVTNNVIEISGRLRLLRTSTSPDDGSSANAIRFSYHVFGQTGMINISNNKVSHSISLETNPSLVSPSQLRENQMLLEEFVLKIAPMWIVFSSPRFASVEKLQEDAAGNANTTTSSSNLTMNEDEYTTRNLKNLILEHNTISMSGIISSFAASTGSAIFIAALSPVQNVEYTSISSNMMDIHDTQGKASQATGFGAITLFSSVRWGKSGRLVIENNQVTMRRFREQKSPGKVSFLNILCATEGLSIDFGFFPILHYKMNKDGVVYVLEFDSLDVNNNTVETDMSIPFLDISLGGEITFKKHMNFRNNNFQHRRGTSEISSSSSSSSDQDSFQLFRISATSTTLDLSLIREGAPPGLLVSGKGVLTTSSFVVNGFTATSENLQHTISLFNTLPIDARFESYQSLHINIGGDETASPSSSLSCAEQLSSTNRRGLVITNVKISSASSNKNNNNPVSIPSHQNNQESFISLANANLNIGNAICLLQTSVHVASAPSLLLRFANASAGLTTTTTKIRIASRIEIEDVSIRHNSIDLLRSSSSFSLFDDSIGDKTTPSTSSTNRLTIIPFSTDGASQFVLSVRRVSIDLSSSSSSYSSSLIPATYWWIPASSTAKINQKMEISDLHLNLPSSSLESSPSLFSLIQVHPQTTSQQFYNNYEASFRNITINSALADRTFSSIVSNLKLISSFGDKSSSTSSSTSSSFSANCIKINGLEPCSDSTIFFSADQNLFEGTYQLCSSTSQCERDRTITREETKVADDDTDVEEENEGQLPGTSDQKTDEDVSTSINLGVGIANALSGGAASSTTTLSMSFLLTLDVIGCPKKSKSGSSWQEQSLTFPSTFLFVDVGGSYHRGAIIGFVIFIFGIPSILFGVAVALGKKYNNNNNDGNNNNSTKSTPKNNMNKNATDEKDTEKKSPPPIIKQLKFITVRVTMLILSQCVAQLASSCGILIFAKDSPGDVILAIMPLVMLLVAGALVAYQISFKLVQIDNENDSGSDNKKNTNNNNNNNNNNGKPFVCVNSKVVKRNPSDFQSSSSSIYNFLTNPQSRARTFIVGYECWSYKESDDCNKNNKYPSSNKNNKQNDNRNKNESLTSDSSSVPIATSALVSTTTRFLPIAPIGTERHPLAALFQKLSGYHLENDTQVPPKSSEISNNNKNQNNKVENNNNMLLKFRKQLRARIVPNMFVITTIISIIVSFCTGVAKRHPTTLCPTMLSIIAVINSLSTAAICFLYPISILPAKGFLELVLRILTTFISIVIASSLTTPEEARANPNMVKIISVLSLVVVTTLGFLIVAIVLLRIGLLNIGKVAIVPDVKNKKATKFAAGADHSDMMEFKNGNNSNSGRGLFSRSSNRHRDRHNLSEWDEEMTENHQNNDRHRHQRHQRRHSSNNDSKSRSHDRRGSNEELYQELLLTPKSMKSSSNYHHHTPKHSPDLRPSSSSRSRDHRNSSERYHHPSPTLSSSVRNRKHESTTRQNHPDTDRRRNTVSDDDIFDSSPHPDQGRRQQDSGRRSNPSRLNTTKPYPSPTSNAANSSRFPSSSRRQNDSKEDDDRRKSSRRREFQNEDDEDSIDRYFRSSANNHHHRRNYNEDVERHHQSHERKKRGEGRSEIRNNNQSENGDRHRHRRQSSSSGNRNRSRDFNRKREDETKRPRDSWYHYV